MKFQFYKASEHYVYIVTYPYTVAPVLFAGKCSVPEAIASPFLKVRQQFSKWLRISRQLKNLLKMIYMYPYYNFLKGRVHFQGRTVVYKDDVVSNETP